MRLVERLAQTAFFLGPGPSADEIAAAVATRARWKETTARDGKNALQATIGHVFVSIEGSLSYEELFQIARSLRRGFPANLML